MLDALLRQNVGSRGGEHRDVGVGVGGGVGGQGLHVRVHRLGHLLGDGDGFDDGARAHDGVTAGEHALTGVLPSSLTVSRPRWLVSMPVVVLTRVLSEP